MKIEIKEIKKNPNRVKITLWDENFKPGEEVYVSSCTMPITANFADLEAWIKRAIREEKQDGIYAH